MIFSALLFTAPAPGAPSAPTMGCLSGSPGDCSALTIDSFEDAKFHDLKIGATNSTGFVGDPTSFAVSSSNGFHSDSYMWLVGDGAAEFAASSSVTHTYTTAGLYAIYVIGTNSTNGSTDDNAPAILLFPVQSTFEDRGTSLSLPLTGAVLSNSTTATGATALVAPGGSVTLGVRVGNVPQVWPWTLGPVSWSATGGTLGITTTTSGGLNKVTDKFPDTATPGIYQVTFELPATSEVDGVPVSSPQEFVFTVLVGTGIGEVPASIRGSLEPGTIRAYESAPGGPRSIDPAIAYNSVALEPIENVYETLIGYNGSASGPAPSDFVPVLATCVPGSGQCAALYGGNALVLGYNYTFVLSNSARFYDSVTRVSWPVYPSDVLFSVARALGFADLPGPEANPGWILGQSLLDNGTPGWDHGIHGSLNNTPSNILSHVLVNDTAFCPRSALSHADGCVTFVANGANSAGKAWPQFLELVASPLGGSIVPCGWFSAAPQDAGIPDWTDNGTIPGSGDRPCLLPDDVNRSGPGEESFIPPTAWDSWENIGSGNSTTPPGLRYWGNVQFSAAGSGPYYLATDTEVGSIAVGSGPWGMAYDPSNGDLFVPNHLSNNVSVISGATNRIVGTVTVGAFPVGATYDPRDQDVYVTNNHANSVSVISASNWSVVATVPVGSCPYAIALNNSSGYLYVSNSGCGAGSTVTVIDGATNSAVGPPIAVGSDPVGIAYDPTNGEVYVANYNSDTVSVISAATNLTVSTVTVGSNPYGVAYDAAAHQVYVTNFGSNSVSVIWDTNNSVKATVSVGSYPEPVTYDPAGQELFVGNSGSDSVSAISDVTDLVVATVPVGSVPYGATYDNSSGNLYVSDLDSSNLTVIAASTLAAGTSESLRASPAYQSNPGCTFRGCLPSPSSYIDNVTVTWDLPTAAGLAALENGTADYTTLAGADLPRVSQDVVAGRANVIVAPTLNLEDWGFNLNFNTTAEARFDPTINVSATFLDSVSFRHFLVSAYPYAQLEDELGYNSSLQTLVQTGGAIPRYMGDFFPTNVSWPFGNPDSNVSDVGGAAWWWAQVTNRSSADYYDAALARCTVAHPCRLPLVALGSGQPPTNPELDAEELAWAQCIRNLTDGRVLVNSYDISGSDWGQNYTDFNYSDGMPYYSDDHLPLPIWSQFWAPDFPDPTDYVNPFYQPNNSYSSPDNLSWTFQQPRYNQSGCASESGSESPPAYWANHLITTACQGTAYYWMTQALKNASEISSSSPSRALLYNLAEHIAANLSLYVDGGQQNVLFASGPWLDPSTFNTNPVLGASGAQTWYTVRYIPDVSNQLVAMQFVAESDPPGSVAVGNTVDVGQSVILSVSVRGGFGADTYSWSGLPHRCASANASSITCVPKSAGTYAISVAVTDARSDRVAVSGSLVVQAAPTVSINATPTATVVGQAMTFEAQPGTGGTAPFSYAWRFGGGETASGAEVVHTFTKTGTYKVKLTLTDAALDTATASLSVTVTSAHVTEKANRTSADVGQTIAFTSAVVNLGTGPYRYAWSGLPTGCTSMNFGTLMCRPSRAGTFEVRVKVTDSGGVSATTPVLTITVAGALSTKDPQITPSRTKAGDVVVVSESVKGGAAPLTFLWQGLPAGCVGGTTVFSCTPSVAGTYHVRVAVTDANGVTVTSGVGKLVVTKSAAVPSEANGRSIEGAPLLFARTTGSTLASARYPLVSARRILRPPPGG